MFILYPSIKESNYMKDKQINPDKAIANEIQTPGGQKGEGKLVQVMDVNANT